MAPHRCHDPAGIGNGGLRAEGTAGAAQADAGDTGCRGACGHAGLGSDGTLMLPGHPHVAYRGDTLCLDGCVLHDLAREYGSPLYVYSRRAMLAALQAYRQALAGRSHRIHYAMKTNSSLAVVQTFLRAGCGVDIVSGGELERALAAGARGGDIVFSGVGKTRTEMQRALEVGVRCFNVESEPELELLSEVAASLGRRAPVSLRVNPDVDAGTHPYISTGLKGNKFGIAHERAIAVYRRAAALPGIEVVGIDCHIGSQITSVAPYLDAVDRVLDLVDALQREGIRLRHLDVGGGLGITYADEQPPGADALVRGVLERIEARGHGALELLLEPGRSLVGNAGVLLTEVLYLKPGEQKNFCIVDAAMNDLLRPTLYDAYMGIVPCRRRDESARTWDVVGPVCESGDWLGRDRALALQPGDVLAVLSAGAYGMAMASNYNSRPRPAEVMVEDGRAWLIREREKVEDLWRGERLAPH
jgi:diaminopimelate decarboxylase